MAKLAEKKTDERRVILYLGDSGAGKTGSLASLARAGYRLRIFDFDNGLATLTGVLAQDEEALARVEYETYRNTFKFSKKGGASVSGGADAMIRAMNDLDKWPDDGSSVESLDDSYYIVFDSLTWMGRAAFEWAQSLNPSAKDPRQWFYAAQELILNSLAALTSPSIRANVLVLTHVAYNEIETGIIKGFPSAVGQALGPKIPQVFNSVILAEQMGSGSKVKRIIRTTPTNTILLKNPPRGLAAEYPLETGLASIDAILSGKIKTPF